MNDDYLWDGSGEPDPEVQKLEQMLGKYRYQPVPLSTALTSHFSWRRSSWVRFAAAAAAVLIVLGALFIFKMQNKSAMNPPELSKKDATEHQPAAEQEKPAEKPVSPVVTSASGEIAKVPVKRKPAPKTYHTPSEEERSLPDADLSFIAARQRIIIPFIDVETARHLEQAQLLLRSFRNSRDSDAQRNPDLSYERQRSRGLLSKNILLRRDAEAKGNMPVDELLGSLEPFLLDIANLPDRPSGEDVRTIKERMQRKEIVAALQIYSAPTLSQVF